MNTSAPYFSFTFNCADHQQDIVMAMLDQIGFDGFVQEPNILHAYIECTQFDLASLTNQISIIEAAIHHQLTYSYIQIESQNWNTSWEKNFEPILVDNLVYVKANFHSELPGIKHTITIQPKMSFGTGHHSTTFLMMQQMLTENFENKAVMDMGCGTGILAILAEKLGAASILAIDNDEWAYANALEMVEENSCTKTTVILGNENNIGNLVFDFILSNITKNFNLHNLNYYKNATQKGSIVFLSGFYEADVQDIIEQAKHDGFIHIQTQVLKDWAVVKLKRI